MHGHCPSTPAPVPSSQAASVSLDVSGVSCILSRTKEGTAQGCALPALGLS